MPFVVIGFFVFFMWGIATMENTAEVTAGNFAAKLRRARTEGLAETINNYTINNGTPPASLAALAATPGYTHAIQYQPTSGPHGNGPYYYLSGNITDSNGTVYQRMIAYHIPLDGSLTPAAYLAASNNTCGGTDPGTDNPWCGNNSGIYWTADTRKRLDNELNAERAQQVATLKKFAIYQNNNGAYPDPGTGNNSAVTLTSRVGYAGTAAACTGIFNWQGIPLGCEDLFSYWGTARAYNYLQNNRIALYIQAPYSEAGQPIAVATEQDNR